jgi:broad specificity phosphatase PhoE
MSKALPRIYLVRHGETAWSITGQHTGRRDIPLTAHGEEEAARLRKRLEGIEPLQVLSSPSQRARRTCELAGWSEKMHIDADLSEWDYGDYDGRTTPDIKKERPDWSLFRDGCPNGETAEEVGRRADRVIACIRALNGDVLLFGHSHTFRILAARARRRLLHTRARIGFGSIVRAHCSRAGDRPLERRWARVATRRGGRIVGADVIRAFSEKRIIRNRVARAFSLERCYSKRKRARARAKKTTPNSMTTPIFGSVAIRG